MKQKKKSKKKINELKLEFRKDIIIDDFMVSIKEINKGEKHESYIH